MIAVSELARSGLRALVFTLLTLTVPCWSQGRLPDSARPLHYALHIAPDAEQLRFEARATITVAVLRPTRQLTLHARDLQIDKVQVRTLAHQPTQAGTNLPKPSLRVEEKRQTLTLAWPTALRKGTYALTFDYRGRIQTQAYGLFAVDYPTPQGQRRALFTQFEPTDARRVFPSWDEPGYRATFDVELVTPAGAMAVANMPQSSESMQPDGRVVHRYATTPAMSTYLLFFGMGDLERRSLQHGTVELGLVTRRGASDQGQFALDAAREVLDHYQDYFGQPYPLPKLDNVAAPGSSTFFSAMENWGAIMTFERRLLLEPRTATLSDRQEVFATLAHEMAHQWFGNLVTMRWWDDLWLNEGFATWMEARTTAALRPAWQRDLDVVDERERAMREDALPSAHAIVQPIHSAEQASQAFDAIAYQKGRMVLRMLEQFVGPDVWQNGVRSYLDRHAYGNTTSADLWRAAQEASHQPELAAIARDFTTQPGVPLVQVVRRRCDGDHSTIWLHQGQVHRLPERHAPRTWRVPVLLRSLDIPGSMQRVLLRGGQARVRVPGCAAVLLNAGQSGYYRATYPLSDWNALAQRLPALSTVDQLGVLADVRALAAVGQVPLALVWNIAGEISDDAAPQVWSATADFWVDLHAMLRRNAQAAPHAAQTLAGAVAPRLTARLDVLGWQPASDEAPALTLLREDLLAALAALADPATLRHARELYAQGQGWASLQPDLRRAVWAIVARHADTATWEQLHQQALHEDDPQVRDELFELLATTESAALAQRALALTQSSEVGDTHKAALVRAVSVLHPELALNFALSNATAMRKLFDDAGWPEFIGRLTRHTDSVRTEARVRAWATQSLGADGRQTVQRALESLRARRHSRTVMLPALRALLAGTPPSVQSLR